jgi:hypothetical protein
MLVGLVAARLLTSLYFKCRPEQGAVSFPTGQSCSDAGWHSIESVIVGCCSPKCYGCQYCHWTDPNSSRCRLFLPSRTCRSQGLADRLSSMAGGRISEADIESLIRARGYQRALMIRRLDRIYGPLIQGKKLDLKVVRDAANQLQQLGGAAGFTRLNGLTMVVAPLASILPPGSCTASRDWQFKSQDFGSTSRSDDAGPQLIMTGPLGARTIGRVSNGEYQLNVGSGFNNFTVPCGTYTVSGLGGKDTRMFTGTLNAASSLQWSNKSTIAILNRAQPLTVTWTGQGLSGYVLFGGAASVGGTRTAFPCVEGAQKLTLTVPDFVVSPMPIAISDRGYLFLSHRPFSNSFSAPRIDAGFFTNFGSDYKMVACQ